MKLTRYDGGRVALISEGKVFDVTEAAGVDPERWPPIDMLNVVAKAHATHDWLTPAAGDPGMPLDRVRLETPVPWPNKVIAFPINYHRHGEEMAKSYRAPKQGFFLKPPSSLSGPCDPIVLPPLPGREVHHECELGIVIGKTVRGISEAEAYDCIFGYACLMDIVVRGQEERVMRKAYDSFCPVGPWIVTSDEVGDPASLDMKLWVGDKLRQQANTRDLVLDIPGMIAMASAVMTLYPGDIIASGTPEGVGPIEPGDKVRIEIERVGAMSVDVVQGQLGYTPAFEPS